MNRNFEEEFAREMGLTFAEFMRTLPAAIAPRDFVLDGRKITILNGSGQVQIKLGETTTRRIASMSLPSTPVAFSFSGMDAEERRKFMEKFDMYFHRGGG